MAVLAKLDRPLAPRVAHSPRSGQVDAEAERKLLLLAPLIDFSERRAAGSLTEVAEHVAARHGMSARHVLRLYRAWEREGTGALARKAYKNRGDSKLFGRVPQAIPDDPAGLLESLTPAGRYIAGLYLRDNFSPRACWDALEGKHAEHGLAEAPSYNAVLRWLQSWPQMVRDYARMTLQQWNDQHRPSVRRDYSTVAVLEWWNLDHGQDDFFCYNDFIPQCGRYAFPDFEPNKWLRMWLTAVQDVRSRYVPGYCFSAIPNSHSIASALRMAVLRCGRPPRVGLTDRGKDFLKTVAEGPRITGALTRLIRAYHGERGDVVKAIGRNPQSKPVEAWFKLKRERFDSLAHSRCGNAPHHRPDSTQQQLDAHEAWMKAGARGVSPSLPRASEAIWSTVQWIEGWYHRKHRHTGDGMNRRTAEQVFRAGWPLEQENAAKARLDLRGLEELLLPDGELRVVRDGGCVRIHNALYEPGDAESLAALRAWDGAARKVEVAFDLDYAVAYDPQTKERIGALVPQRRFAWGERRESIKAHLRTRGNGRRAVKGIVGQLAQQTTAEQPFGVLEATGTDGLALIASSPRVLRAKAERAERKQLKSPFISDAVKEVTKDFWEKG